MSRCLSLALVALLASACSGSPGASDAGASDAGVDAGPPGCTVTFSGNYVDQVSLPGGCGGLRPSGTIAGDWVLALSATSTVIGATTTVNIDLGPSPEAGTFSDSTIASWSAIAVTQSQCEYSAGGQGVPPGDFTMTLTEVSGLPSAPQVHGTLHVEQHVSAPAAVDCGPGDVEELDFQF